MSEAFLIELSPREGVRHRAQQDAVLGREGSDILLPDPEVSRRHAAIRIVDGEIAIEDLGSRNGTMVNEERIDGVCVLRDGDRLQVGDTMLRFDGAGGDARKPSARQGRRGDVPAPEAVPSVVRRAPPLEAIGPPRFTPPRGKIRGSAARRVEATVVSYVVVLATAVAVVLYFAAR